MLAIQLLEPVFNRHSFKYIFLTFSFPRTLRHSIKWFFCPSSGSSLVPLQSLHDPPLISSLTKYYTIMNWHPQAIVPKPSIQHSPEGINGGSQCPPAEPSPCRVFRSTTYIIRLLYDDAGRYYSSLPLLPTRPSHLQLSNMPLLCNLFSCNPLFLL